jgi:transcriptional regulator
VDLLIFPIPNYLKLGYGRDIELDRKELMYLPNKFHCQDRKAIQSLMERYPLATLVTIVDGSPIISHLPLVVEADSTGNMVLLGHMPKANPHSRHIANSETTIIFQGPNAYITPKWYEKNDVPTWNYAVVHCKGSAKPILDFNGIQKCLQKLTESVERHSLDPWEFWLPEDLNTPADLTAALMGFEICVTQVKAKFKLSQNRSQGDLKGIITGLNTRADDYSKEILNLIKTHTNLDI